MPHLRAFLSGPKRAIGGDGGGWVNPGLTLRWHAALGTMEEYNALPRDVALRATLAFVSDVRARVAAAGPHLCAVGDEGGAHVDYFVGGSSGIVSVAVYVATDPSLPPPPSASRYARCLLPASSAVDTPSHPRHSFSPPPPLTSSSSGAVRALSFDECKAFHQLMASDLSRAPWAHAALTAAAVDTHVDPRLLATRVMLGQPVSTPHIHDSTR